METFPSIPAPRRPIKIESEFKTLVSEFDSGKEQRRRLWTFPRRSINLTFRPRQADTETLWKFYHKRAGMYEPFYYVMPYAENHEGEYVAKGDGQITTFDLPSIGTNSGTLVVYVDSVQTAVTFISGGGDADADRIQFATAPASGATITADLNGKLRFKSRFGEDKFNKEMFEYFLYNIGITLKEVR